MAKSNIFQRVKDMARANINAMLDKAEDPKKMLDQMVRDYADNISEATEATAEQIGHLRSQQNKYSQHLSEAAKFDDQANSAVNLSIQSLQNNDAEKSERYDASAKLLINKAEAARKSAEHILPTIQNAEEQITGLKGNIGLMNEQLVTLKTKRDELAVRAQQAEVQERFAKATKQIDITDPTSNLGRFEEMIERREAKVAGASELAAARFNSPANQFAIESAAREDSVTMRLEEMKARAMKALDASKNEEVIDVETNSSTDGMNINYSSNG